MRVRTFDLGSTETYKQRVAVLVEGLATAADRFLTITTRAGRKTVTTTYAMNTDRSRPHLVAHLRPLRGDDGKGEEGGPYWVECRDGKWSCNCRGNRPGHSCKHADACKKIKESE